jgi:hypothetical protein
VGRKESNVLRFHSPRFRNRILGKVFGKFDAAAIPVAPEESLERRAVRRLCEKPHDAVAGCEFSVTSTVDRWIPGSPRRGENGLCNGPRILRQLTHNFETFSPCPPLLVVVLAELQTAGYGCINFGTNPTSLRRRPVFKERLSHETQDTPSDLTGF